MRNHFNLALVCCLVALAGVPSFAPIVPGLDLPGLCDRADLIAVGRAAAVREGAHTTIVLQGRNIPGRFMVVELDVEKFLKGPSTGAVVTFRFSVVSVPIVSFGYQQVSVGQFGVFFLRKSEAGYEVLDPYHPSVVAFPGALRTSGSLLDQVTAEVARALLSGQVSIGVKEQALRVLDNVRTPMCTAALKDATRDRSAKVRLGAIAALLARNDISVLDSAEKMMLSQDQEIAQQAEAAVAYGLSLGVKDPRDIPLMARLLQSREANIRRAAASALRNTQDRGAIKPLTEALYDTDREVQYQAVIGLAEITGAASEWSPATETFEKDPQRYLDHWREWATANK